MYVSVPPRFGVSAAAAGAAKVATQKTAPRPAAANSDFLIMTFPPSGCWGGLVAPSSTGEATVAQRRNAAPRRKLTHLAAGHPVAGAHLPQLRTHPAAALDRNRTTRMKHAARRRIDRTRHLTFHGFELAVGLDARIRNRHRVEKRPGIRMQRVVEQLVAIGQLDDAAEIHHRDTLTEMPYDREIVGDEQVGETEARAQILEQVDDLRLDRHVERGHCLVANDEFGLERERARDPDPLALAARHLVRIAVGKIRAETADREQLAHPPRAARRIGLDGVHLHRLGDDVADLHARIERAVRILEDDLDAAPQRQQLLVLEPGKIDAVIEDLAGGRPLEQQDAAAGCRLAATTLADQPQRLAAAKGEVDAVDRPHLADQTAR